MARMRTLADRAEQLLGTAVVSTTPVAGGDVCTATRLRLSDGRSALIKTRPHAPEDFFEAEARGLRWLAEPGVAEVAEVLAVASDCIVLPWIEPSRPSPESAGALGRMLARLPRSPLPEPSFPKRWPPSRRSKTISPASACSMSYRPTCFTATGRPGWHSVGHPA